jgi:hypothetical protein
VPTVDGNYSTIPGFDAYEEVPASMRHVSDPETVGEVVRKVQGGPGPSGVDAYLFHALASRFGTASLNLRLELAKWSEWLSNESPPWAAIRALNAKRGVATDKEPGTRPLHVGEVYMRMMIGKDLLRTAADEAKDACGCAQLCAGLEAGVEGGLHAARASWGQEGWTHDSEPAEDNPFLPFVEYMESDADVDDCDWEKDLPTIDAESASLFDARNGFNELHRYQMLWNVRHRWAKGSRLAFNCYRHFNLIIFRRGSGRLAYVVTGQEGVSQGDPLAMILYGVALLPLVEKLRVAVPEATTPWFADDAAAIGNALDNATALEFLAHEGKAYGWYAEPEKTHVICTKEEEPEVKAAFLSRGFVEVKFSRGQRYLGGFIGSEKAKHDWV